MRRAVKSSSNVPKGARIGVALAFGILVAGAATAAEDASTSGPSTAAAPAQTDGATKSARRAEHRSHRKAAAEPAKETVAANAAPTVPSVLAPPADVECRTTKATGSRIPKRVCATSAAWVDADSLSRQRADQMRRENLDRSLQAQPPTHPYTTPVFP